MVHLALTFLLLKDKMIIGEETQNEGVVEGTEEDVSEDANVDESAEIEESEEVAEPTESTESGLVQPA